ncbi:MULTISPECIES: amino acid ABC transporter permease [Streptomyces]|uniref:Inner membrane amino-acid ABC transporter permease protein YhdY n=2 Tax=Streptomyces TaxID=1883 RepID=A0A1D8G7I2_9ACTN|nr:MULTISPECIES: amino acid ABC transporter permease [Streptomyces]AOT61404.1 Inner membrane amino-acid ABC transporter permease protein YhdY [Streptomyces rubrolavendulae]KAF0648802.1 glutamate ABC transporter permease [Streptomyces fradiae ATCC 10745 = DSM 40063]OSY49309.1 Inner membrane amino-acid ABC transporter permease protein YhdY [Streptomyces fradiae ATCC 10745 = DSM 40063]QEV14399.1 amino acid ABC transporter permease [Streptomyces fradiae ATCC 10745 = DSM 40063]UQS30373.1 amino acid
MSSVLYDTPGPKARLRNILYSAVFVVLVGLVVWWALSVMADKGQLAADKWKPFVTDGAVWTTFLLPGLVETLKAAGLALVIALPLGALLGIGRLSDHAWVRGPVGAVVEFFRAIPVLLMMIFANAVFAQFTPIASEVRPLYAVVTGLVLYNASVIAEIVRAGILSLPYGQTDAAKAIGMRKGQIMGYVLLPQAVTAMLPALVSQLVVIVKDTALGGAILGLSELLFQIRPITANYGANTIATITVVALIYILVNGALTQLAAWLEGLMRRRKKSTGAVVDIKEIDSQMGGGVA